MSERIRDAFQWYLVWWRWLASWGLKTGSEQVDALTIDGQSSISITNVTNGQILSTYPKVVVKYLQLRTGSSK